MLCPYCSAQIHFDRKTTDSVDVSSGDRIHLFFAASCPSCEGVIVEHVPMKYELQYSDELADWYNAQVEEASEVVYPRRVSRPPLAPQVPQEYAEDYNEAVLVLTDSPKASAALSRRALQRLLHEHLNIEKKNLYQEIQELLDSEDLPTYLAEALDSVRNIGNFAAHPLKIEHTGEIVDVEPGEAEWLIEVLEHLYDHYFVKPALLQERKAALNEKLKSLGKPPMR